MVARLLWEQDVAGSNPVIPTKRKFGASCPEFLFPSERRVLTSMQGHGKEAVTARNIVLAQIRVSGSAAGLRILSFRPKLPI